MLEFAQCWQPERAFAELLSAFPDDSTMHQVSILSISGRTFERTPIKTHMAMFGEDLAAIVSAYTGDRLDSLSVLCLSEKFVAICQNNVRHISTVRVSGLARLIVRFVTKYPNDIGYSHPKKMQVAIDEAGYLRMVAATVIGGFSKLILRRRGDFYRIAGHRISEIDGFNPEAMKPFDEYAMLPPRDPDGACESLALRFGCACYIIDGNNINVEVIGSSQNLSALGIDRAFARQLMLDNPMGQHDELTPIFILREVQPSNTTDTNGTPVT